MSKIAMMTMALLLLAPLPAQAQAPGFGVFLGDDERDFFGDYPERITCLTDRQIRDDIAGRGYTNIALNVANRDRIEVRATRDGWVYLLDFNFCSGSILGRTQLRPAG